jgi:hypothetical protein
MQAKYSPNKQKAGRQAEAWLLGNSIIPNANLWLA